MRTLLYDRVELVFDNLQEALAVVRKIKKSRVRSFSSYDEARAFASTRVADAEVKTSSSDAEAQSIGNFKSPTTPELNALRRVIERGTCEDFERLVRSNPRYLISSADTAVLLMAGPRYNAAHIAAKAGRADMLKVLLDAICDPQFIRMLYPADDSFTTESRLHVILDCYLNTPDKGVSG